MEDKSARDRHVEPVKQSDKASSGAESCPDLQGIEDYHYHRILDSFPYVVYTKDLQGKYTLINDQFENLSGLSRESVLGRTDFELFPKAVAENSTANDKIVIETGMPLDIEEFAPIHGRMQNFKSSKYPLRDENGRIYGICGISVNISERKKVENELEVSKTALKESEKRLRRILESTEDIIIVQDTEGRYIYYNGPSAYGIDKDNILGKTPYDFFDPETASAMMEHTNTVIKTGKRVEKETTVVWQGKTLCFLDEINPVLNSKGKVIATSMLSRNITERKKIEDRLRESEQKYRNIFENAVEGLFQCRPDGCFITVNPALVEMLGYKNPAELIDDLTDLSTQFFVNPADETRYRKQLSQTGTVKNMEFRVWRKDCAKIWISISTRTIYDQAGEIVLYEGNVSDITTRKSTQEKALQLHKTESLARMAGAVAHNFNNMLAVVIGNLEIVMEDPTLRQDIMDGLDEAKSAARRAAKMSGLMLTFLGRQQGISEICDLSIACRVYLKQTASELPDGITLKVDLPVPGKTIEADPSLVNRVLGILITNAREAIEPSAGEISVTSETVNAKDILDDMVFPLDWEICEQDYACLIIADTGKGMDENTMKKIFDPFFSSKFAGRGLGLAVASGIVKSWKGCISVNSHLGRGSTFKVFWPLSNQKVTVSDRRLADQETSLKMEGTVLLVEDQDMVRQVTGNMLERLGFDVITAENGEQGFEVFRKMHNHIRLVISDYTMPRMNGWDMLKAIRSVRTDMPVIIASGYDELQTMAEADQEQPQAFLHKPFLLKTLKQTIEKALSGS